MKKLKRSVIYEVLSILVFIVVFIVAYSAFSPLTEAFIQLLTGVNSEQAAKAAKIWNLLPATVITIIVIWGIVSAQRKQPQNYYY